MRVNHGLLRGWWTVPWLSLFSLAAAGREVPLVEAVKKADVAAVRTLLQQQVDVNSAEVDGTTALHWATHRDDLETVELLIHAGANVTSANRYGVMPLSLASSNGNAAIVERLLNAGADPNTATPEGETALMSAARTGNADTVQVLLARGANVNATETWRGQTALMWAAVEGHAAAVEALIDAGADIHARSSGAPGALDRQGRPVAPGVAGGRAPDRAASPAPTPAGPTGLTPLLYAVRGGHIDTVRVLLAAGANVNEVAPDGTSALVLAIINAHYELAAALLDKGADPNAADLRGSALHALTWMRNPGYPATPPRIPTGQLDSVELATALLEHGANPNVRIAWKEIKFDVDAGAVKGPPNIAIGRNYMSFIGATPFYLAARGADIPLMRLLVSHGADPLAPTVQKVTPLMAAAGLGFWDGESPGPESGVPESQALEAVTLTWELGNDVNAVTDYGDVKLEGDGVTLLRRHPLNLEVLPETALGDMRWGGSTALHGAALRGANAIVQFLVEKGAKIDAKNTLGWTPLTVAEGIFVANTEKAWPSTAALLRQLMSQTAATNPRPPR